MSEHPHQFEPEAWVDDVLELWFGQLRPDQWFKSDPALDFALRERFIPLLDAVAERVAAGDMSGSPDGVLATCIVLDQFPRNMFRGTERAFQYDELARQVCRGAITNGTDLAVPPERRLFVYLPLEHAEDEDDQADAVRLIGTLGNPEWTRYAEAHRDIVARFGRFPHRNACLGRPTTDDEAEFLKQPGSAF